MAVPYLYAQVWDDFSYPFLNNNSIWEGNTQDFKINNQQQLQLNASAGGSTYINTPIFVNGTDSFYWEFWFNLGFAPSANNQFRFYLMASGMDFLASNLDGIYLEIGENGSNDPIKIVKQNGTSHTLIGSGVAGSVYAQNAPKRIRVLKTPADSFFISFDSSAFYSFKHDFKAHVNINFSTNFMGIWCKYTQSNTQNFYFDDISFDLFTSDQTAPKLLNGKILTANKLAFLFSEPIHKTLFYASQISRNNESPTLLTLDTDQRVLIADFNTPMQHATVYNIEIKNVYDTAQNKSSDTNLHLTFIKPVPFDLVINEIHADPTPTIGLPNTEYVELFNTQNYSIQTKYYKLCIENNCISLPDKVIPAKGLGLIIPNSFINYFPGLNVLPVSSLPSINNTEAKVSIRDTGNTLIDFVKFHISWYNDPIKDDGGFSLERINPYSFCDALPNFTASNSYTGGTPGYTNSVFDTTLIPLKIITAYMVDTNKFEIVLNKYTKTSNWSIYNFQDSLQFSMVSSIIFKSRDTIQATLNFIPAKNKIFKIRIQYFGADCNNSGLELDTLIPLKYYKPNWGDIVISEILGNPKSGSKYPYEFIELYNRTNLPLNLNEFKFTNSSSEYPLPNKVLYPGEYVALSSKAWASGEAISIPLPTLPNEFAQFTLVHNSNTLIHRVEYNIDFFEDAQKKAGGYSLELSDLNALCNQSANWKECLSPDGATPGKPNSRTQDLPQLTPPQAVYRGVSADTITLFFSKAIHPNLIKEATLYSKGNKLNGNWYIHKSNPLIAKFKVYSAIPWGEEIEITNLYSCETNEKGISKIQLPSNKNSANTGLQINEVLFYPQTGRAKYVELYNYGDSAISLKNLYLGKYDTSLMVFISGSILCNEELWLLPNELICFTTNPKQTIEDYPMNSPDHIWFRSKLDLPSSSGAILALRNDKSKIIDLASINPNYHTSFISEHKGIALERTYVYSNGLNKSAWASASKHDGYGTPGKMNSQWIENFKVDEILELSSEYFSPDQDGLEDLVQIKCKFTDKENQINLQIYNEYGQLIKTLARNEYVGTNYSVVWDGGMQNGAKAPIGIYKVVLDGYNQSGKKIKDSKILVLAIQK